MLRAVGSARCIHRRAARQVLHWFIAVAILAAGRPDAAAQTVAAAAPTALTINVTDQAFQAPDTIPAGFTTFRLVNDGEQAHMATLIRLEPGRSAEEFVEAYRARFETGGERPAWARYLGGPGGTFPRGESNATLYLEPGSYVMVCGVPFPDGHLLKPHAFEVRPRSGDASEPSAPEPTVSLRLVDHRFQLSETLRAGKHLIHVENVGVEPHEVILVKLAPGKTVDDLQVWVRNPTGEAETPITEVSGVTALAMGAEAYFEADLSAGDYVLFCVIPGSDGRPHIEYGMIQHIRIG